MHRFCFTNSETKAILLSIFAELLLGIAAIRAALPVPYSINKKNGKINMTNFHVLEEFQRVREHIRETQQKEYIRLEDEIGDFSYGIPKVYSWGENARLIIGKFCSIASGVSIFLGGNHRVDWNSTYPFNTLMPESFSYIMGHPSSKGDVVIGNDVWIGSDSKIMSGVAIADGCIVGANALVTQSVLKPYTVVGGVPAKIIKRRFSSIAIRRLCKMQWWNWKDNDIITAIPLLQSNDMDGLWRYYIELKRRESTSSPTDLP